MNSELKMVTTILTADQKEKFDAELKKQNDWFARGRRLFNIAHHASLIISIVSSAAAAIVPQLDGLNPIYQKNLSSILAGIAAVLLTLDTAGGFGKRWRLCRINESKAKRLRYELIEREPTSEDVQRLIQIERDHAKAMTS